MERRKLTRRFLHLSAASAVGAATVACQPQTVVVEKEVERVVTQVVKETVKETVVVAGTPKVVEKEITKIVEKEVTSTPVPIREAPELYGLVAAGSLPSVDERLPMQPMVMEPLEEVGQYGGSLRTLMSTTDGTKIHTISCYEHSLRYDREVRTMEPNVVKAWEVSEDGSTFTLFYRQGVKWSDGAPFTVDDLMFYFEDVLGNEELTPSYPTWLALGGTPPEYEKVDDYTVTTRFPTSYGFFVYQLVNQGALWRPRHYLEQFHPDYAAKAELDSKVKEAGFANWYELFPNRADQYNKQNPDYPEIEAWYPTTEPPATRYTFKRNPYYWKVDTEGNQLPYIDEEIITIVEDAEVLKLRALAGKADLQQNTMTFDFYPLLKENEEAGGYRVLLWDNDNSAYPAIMPNQNTKDEVLRELIQDDRFRIALSHAINREQVNEMVFHGAGVPGQGIVCSSSPSYKEEYGRAHADYDPEKSNAILDEIGLTARDADGFRIRRDGTTLFLLLETTGEDPAATSQMELVKTYWEEVGVKTDVRASERGVFRSRVVAGENILPTWNEGIYNRYKAGSLAPLSQTSYWAPLYGQWYATGGKAGEEPPGDIRKLQIIYDQLLQTVDMDKQEELFVELLDLHTQHRWKIGIVGEVPRPVVVNNRIRNIPERALCSWAFNRYLGSARLEQLFFKG
jgi:peptide/nickel transport system substrate-binding protein